MTRISLLMLIGFLVVSCQMPTSELRPLSFVLVSGIGRSEVRWEPVPGADRYRVVWTPGASNPAGGGLETTAGSATAEGLVPGVDYTFTVSALSGDQPVAQAARPWRSEGWTWVADPVVLLTVVTSEAESFDLGDGNWVIFISNTTVTTERLERLNYGSGGLTRTTWLRVTTESGKAGTTVVDKEETVTPGNWVRPWVEFSAGGTGLTTFSPNRTSFTLDGAPDVFWHQSR